MKKSHPVYRIILALFVFSLAFLGEGQAATVKEDIKTIAILPFQINASEAEDLAYIKNGMIRMLNSRLSWRENVVVISGNRIKNHLSRIDNISRTKQISEIARLTHSDFVLAGSITGIGGSFSIDAQVYDIKNKRYMAFFEQSKKIDDLIGKTNRIAATINKKIFSRTTVVWKNMEQEKQAYIKEQKRRNPEFMMKTPEWQNTEESPGWKIWKYLF